MPRHSDTKHRISRAALDLFITKGVTETTTREIAQAADVAEGSIYRHFESKEALAWELFRNHFQHLTLSLEAAQRPHDTLRDKAEAIVRTWCRLAEEDWSLFTYYLLVQHRHLARVADEDNPVQVLRRVIADAMDRGEIPRRDVETITAMALGVVMQPAIHRIYTGQGSNLSDNADLFVQAVWTVLTLPSLAAPTGDDREAPQ
jgi:AcrR family transcriptional regulator